MVRLHVGLEGTEDLWRDIERALEQAEALANGRSTKTA
jgi:cystathionine beta-lyase/cystathionine gamma-synthase